MAPHAVDFSIDEKRRKQPPFVAQVCIAARDLHFAEELTRRYEPAVLPIFKSAD